MVRETSDLDSERTERWIGYGMDRGVIESLISPFKRNPRKNNTRSGICNEMQSQLADTFGDDEKFSRARRVWVKYNIVEPPAQRQNFETYRLG